MKCSLETVSGDVCTDLTERRDALSSASGIVSLFLLLQLRLDEDDGGRQIAALVTSTNCLRSLVGQVPARHKNPAFGFNHSN
jgi:hypothetical protein